MCTVQKVFIYYLIEVLDIWEMHLKIFTTIRFKEGNLYIGCRWEVQ
jgi:hypothetical protein